MTAASFAEEGEFETAREILKEQRKILFAVTGEKSDINTFRYALNMCKRIDAVLEILYVSEHVNDLLKQFQSELEKQGMEHYFIQRSGSLEEEIQNYTGMKSGILYVVVEVSEGLNINSKETDKILSDAWKNLRCPLIIVSHGKTSFTTKKLRK